MALFYAHLVSLSLVCVLCIRLVAQHYDLSLLFHHAPGSPIFARTLKAGLAVLPSNMVARLFGDGPPIVLNAWLPGSAGAVAAGLYAIARKVSSIVQLVRTAFAYVLAPLASAASTGHQDQVREIYAFATRIMMAIALPLGLTLIASGPAILSLFGKEAAVAFPALAILVAARIIEAISGAAAPIQQVTRGYKSQLVGSSLGLAVAAIVALSVMPNGGLAGMSLAVAAGLIVAGMTPLIQQWARGGLHPFEPPFMRALLTSLAVAAAGSALAFAALSLPVFAKWPLIIAVLVAAIWCSCRFALPIKDRQQLGKMGRTLKLI
jgi:O-antigen/teichoic acid export membrane protein